MSQTQEILLESTLTNPKPPDHAPNPTPSKARAITTVLALSGVSFLNTMGSGILTVALPAISTDLSLSQSILLWPASVYALAAGCTLLIFGSVADVVGDKRVWVTGSISFAAFTLACGLAKTGTQLITFRTLLGISIAMCLPCSVSLMTRTFPPGKARNMGFAVMGMGQPVGYSVGLLVGGVFADRVTWRAGYFVSAGVNALLCLLGWWSLPRETVKSREEMLIGLKGVDWIGALIISISLALLSFVLAQITESYHNLGKAYIIALFAVSLVLLPAFAFSFQEIQHRSALSSSLMFLPMVVAGAVTNIFTGYTVDKVSVGVLVSLSAIISTVSPLLMAVVKPEWGYWRGPFIAMMLSPVHSDVLFTVSNLIISLAYPGQNQALAGAVFNSVSQVGNSVGLAVSAAIAASVTEHSVSDQRQLKGFQAAYWLMLAAMGLVCDLVTTDIQTALPEAVVAEIISQAPFVTVPGIFNLRDLSNATTPSSAHPAVLRPGLAYRAAAPVPTMTDEGIAALNALGIKKIYDLRRPDERTKKPSPVIDGVEVVWILDGDSGIPLAAQVPASEAEADKSIDALVRMYLGFLRSHAGVYKAVFTHIRDEPEKPFLFHCSAGKDRTGVLAALIHRLAGSSDEAIIHDFTLTRVGLEPGREALLQMMRGLYGESAWDNPVLLVLWGVHASGMTGFLKVLDEEYGGVTGYLRNKLGFDEADIETMQRNLAVM
ncbi:major facilitator superfamily domain-containing protein [Aspergillus unguis]